MQENEPFSPEAGEGAAAAAEGGLAWRATVTDERAEADRSGGRGRYGARMAGEDAAGAATAAGTRDGGSASPPPFSPPVAASFLSPLRLLARLHAVGGGSCGQDLSLPPLAPPPPHHNRSSPSSAPTRSQRLTLAPPRGRRRAEHRGPA